MVPYGTTNTRAACATHIWHYHQHPTPCFTHYSLFTLLTPGLDNPAVVLCSGDRTGCGAFQNVGGAAAAALVDGGVDTEVSPLCSSLSLTACFLGNRGALAIAKACCRRKVEELCLENCGIGNAGAAALALALEEGATMGRIPPGNSRKPYTAILYLRRWWQCDLPANANTRGILHGTYNPSYERRLSCHIEPTPGIGTQVQRR